MTLINSTNEKIDLVGVTTNQLEAKWSIDRMFRVLYKHEI